MNVRLIYTLFGLFLLMACSENWIKKPEGLIPKNKMVDMLVDLHISQAVFQSMEFDPSGKNKLKSEDFYYSVLKKYNVIDTVFEKSIIYYSNFPKEFEKIYATVLDKANQMQEEYKIKASKPVTISDK